MRMSVAFKFFTLIVGASVILWVVTVMMRRSSADLSYLDGQMRSEISRLQTLLKESHEHSHKLKAVLSQKGVKQAEIDSAVKSVSDGSFMRDLPASRTLLRDFATDDADLTRFCASVTILIYNDYRTTECVLHQLVDIRNKLPTIKIVVASQVQILIPEHVKDVHVVSTGDSVTEGTALNKMFAHVKTKYFFYLSKGATVSEFKSNNGPGWLFHALEKVPELDFVGGSILSVNKTLPYKQLEVQCYRLKMCYYVFAESYEYKYSVGDVMICEETSTTFMGRVSSLGKVGSFDTSLNSMVLTDFFWRAKGKALVGLRPEVFFHVEKMCTPDVLSPRERSLRKQAFMEKYELVRVRDSYGTVTQFPDPRRSPAYTKSVWGRPFHYTNDGGFASPLMTEKLQFYTKFFDEFFRSRNITYFTDSGVPLGGIKMRTVLPWDTGDIDTGYWGKKWPELLKMMEVYCKEKKVSCNFETHPSSFKTAVGPPKGLQTIIVTTAQNHGAHDDMYSHEWEAPHGNLIYVDVNGVYLPVELSLFTQFRADYGLSYLEMADNRGSLVCKVEGHHACAPKAFRYGGGYWKDFYCNL